MTDRLTNSQLLADDVPPGRLLFGLEKQRQFVLRVERGPFPCPNCGTLHAKWEIHGLTVDEYDLSKPHGDEGKCKGCGIGLRYVVPLVGDVHITVIPDPARAMTFETVRPEALQVDDTVRANGALMRITEFGKWQNRSDAGRPEYIEVECVDPLGTSFAVGFSKQLALYPESGANQRHHPDGGDWERLVR